jgi:hypothetical protein
MWGSRVGRRGTTNRLCDFVEGYRNCVEYIFMKPNLVMFISPVYVRIGPHPKHISQLMPSTSALRALHLRVPRTQGRRFASHGSPHYNEPSGWIFGEKVFFVTHRHPYIRLIWCPWSLHFLDRNAKRKSGSPYGTLGCSVPWDSPPCCCITSLTQGPYSKSHESLQFLINILYSIQTWALKEAKERMEARGEKYQYKPSWSSLHDSYIYFQPTQ